MMSDKPHSSPYSRIVLVAALGYFVDIYDLQLFNVISRQSLLGIGITDTATLDRYDYLLFLWQMAGMLIGGLLWGILGDKRGRKSVLFGSIILYSLANIANAFVVNVEQYAAIRFVAGLGLAGELGAAITLVSEVMHREKRGYGTMLIVTMGALGAVAAALVSHVQFDLGGLQNWQTAYLIGGALGLLLLFLRVGTFESGMFDRMKQAEQRRGDFFMLFRDGKRFRKYVACILIGLPVWFCIGILIKFAPVFADLNGPGRKSVDMGYTIMFAYLGLSVGDLFSGLLSQFFRSRKKIVIAYLFLSLLLTGVYLYWPNESLQRFYILCFLIGCATGYWALFVTIASEQFGTNIRATVTTTVPNFVRGAVIPITLGYKTLESNWGDSRLAALAVGLICIFMALAAMFYLRDSFSNDLDYTEVS